MKTISRITETDNKLINGFILALFMLVVFTLCLLVVELFNTPGYLLERML